MDEIKRMGPVLLTIAACGCSAPAVHSAEPDSGASTAIIPAVASRADAGSLPLEKGGAIMVEDAGPALPAPPPSAGIQLHTTPFVMQPGEENVVCQVLSTAHPAMNLSSFEVSERFGMHHMTLYYGPAGASDPCVSALYPIFLAQQQHVSSDLSGGAPEYRGAFLKIPEGTFVVKIHAMNNTDQPATIEAWINLETLPTSGPQLSFLSLSAGSLKMNVPAHTASTYKASVAPPSDTTIVQMIAHTHSHTKEERATYDGRRIYTSSNWEDAPEVRYNSLTAPLVVKAGTALEWECDIDNTLDTPLVYAELVDKGEMCNLFGLVSGPNAWIAGAP